MHLCSKMFCLFYWFDHLYNLLKSLDRTDLKTAIQMKFVCCVTLNNIKSFCQCLTKHTGCLYFQGPFGPVGQKGEVSDINVIHLSA